MSRQSEIRERLEKATPGGWDVSGPYLRGGDTTKHPHYEISGGERAEWLAHVLCYSDKHAGTRYEANARLVSNAPSDLRYLLDRLEVAEKLVGDAAPYIVNLPCDEPTQEWVASYDQFLKESQ